MDSRHIRRLTGQWICYINLSPKLEFGCGTSVMQRSCGCSLSADHKKKTITIYGADINTNMIYLESQLFFYLLTILICFFSLPQKSD